MMNRALVFAALVLAPVFSASAAFGCECMPRTQPEPREGSVKKTPTYEFSWYSDADKGSDDQYCYERIVNNKHDNSNVDYEWPISEMDNKALPPNERDRICKVRGGAYRDPAAKGPLNYGRNNPPTETEVWKAQAEPRTGETRQVASYSPLEALLEFVFEAGGRRFRNAIVVRSFATAIDTPGGRVFRCSYSFENLRDDPPLVSWEIPGLPERMKGDPRLMPLLRGAETGLGVEIRGLVGIPFSHKQPPMVGTFPVYFFEPGGKRMAKGNAEEYVP